MASLADVMVQLADVMVQFVDVMVQLVDVMAQLAAVMAKLTDVIVQLTEVMVQSADVTPHLAEVMVRIFLSRLPVNFFVNWLLQIAAINNRNMLSIFFTKTVNKIAKVQRHVHDIKS